MFARLLIFALNLTPLLYIDNQQKCILCVHLALIEFVNHEIDYMRWPWLFILRVKTCSRYITVKYNFIYIPFPSK